jgi:hypothetical protein
MHGSHPSFVLGFHGCDRSVGLRVLNGEEDLKPSTNIWDWLGSGIYFWEHDPELAMSYAKDVATRQQFAKGAIKEPFVLGAIIDLGKCLNTSNSKGIEILRNGHSGLVKALEVAGALNELPRNIGENRRFLDCAVLEYVHQQNKENDCTAFDTVRGAFQEGDPIYEGAYLTAKNHIQICVRNPECIRGYFLPRNVG